MEFIARLEGNVLKLELPVERPVMASSTGKTLLVASTHGTVTTDQRFRGRSIVITANAFVYRLKKPKHKGRRIPGRQPTKRA